MAKVTGINIEIGKKKIELSMEDARKLYEVFKEMFDKQIIIEKTEHHHHGYPYPYRWNWIYPTTQWDNITVYGTNKPQLTYDCKNEIINCSV